jgi:quinoprotein glucose dehydrogenase
MTNCSKFRLISCLLPILASGLAASAQEWRSYGGDPGGTRSSSLTQITPQNVAQLQPAWVYHTGEVRREQRSTGRHRIPPFESTPLVVDDVLYFSTPSNRIIALDAGTGRELW